MVVRHKNLRNRRRRGFTLIELGIVVAVIAVLATVVLLGKGFIDSSKVTKVVESVGTVRKGSATYAGLNGGVLPNSAADEMGKLIARQLLPTTVDPWPVITGWEIREVRFRNASNQNQVLIQVHAPDTVRAEDVFNSFRTDPNQIKTAENFGGVTCSTAVTTQDVNMCFNL